MGGGGRPPSAPGGALLRGAPRPGPGVPRSCAAAAGCGRAQVVAGPAWILGPGLAAVVVLGTAVSGLAEGARGSVAALGAALAAPATSCGAPDLDARELAAFYRGAPPAPLWVDGAGVILRARQLRAAVERAEEHGLPPARHGLAAIQARWLAGAPGERACLDLLLTTAFARLGRDLATGVLPPREADRAWHLPLPTFDAVAALRGLPAEADVGAFLEDLAPSHGLYRRLRGALAHYRRLAAAGGWDPVPAGPPLHPGDASERIAALRERLRREGDLGPGPAAVDSRYDDGLAAAVRQFQRRHGLRMDGVVGPRTLAAVNVPAAERVAQLRRAMERVRWLPRDLGPHHVLVNTAGFALAVVEGDRAVLGMRVVVGSPDQRTPSFTATLRSLVINPYWNVPARIARDKLLPRERRDPGHLAARGFRILDARTGQWREPDAAALAQPAPRVRQDPGPGNLMGRLSFAFPNPHDVFLHDTPDRSLFELEVRSCSEGCVRIEQAMALALHTLRRAPEWTAGRIQDEIDALRHRVIPLPEPIPVYVVYLPTWVDEDGLVHFRPDHYRRESVLARHFPAG